MTQMTTTLRLRRVRFKNGNVVEVLRPKNEDIGKKLRATAVRATECFGPSVAAFAVVVWNTNGEVLCNYEIGDRSHLVAGQIPQSVKDVLLAEVAIRWARD